MFDGPIRGGTRGGQGEFKWTDVSADKDREASLLFVTPIQTLNLSLELSRSLYQRPNWPLAKEQGCPLVQS